MAGFCGRFRRSRCSSLDRTSDRSARLLIQLRSGAVTPGRIGAGHVSAIVHAICASLRSAPTLGGSACARVHDPAHGLASRSSRRTRSGEVRATLDVDASWLRAHAPCCTEQRRRDAVALDASRTRSSTTALAVVPSAASLRRLRPMQQARARRATTALEAAPSADFAPEIAAPRWAIRPSTRVARSPGRRPNAAGGTRGAPSTSDPLSPTPAPQRGGHYGLGTRVILGSILPATVTDDEDPAVYPAGGPDRQWQS